MHVQIPVANILLGGLCFAKAKPPMNMFLFPVMNEIELQENVTMLDLLVGLLYVYSLVHLSIQCKWIPWCETAIDLEVHYIYQSYSTMRTLY